ncbi:MAG: parallel beta-helix domain-containing protein [Acidobacteriota bacterium]|nr:right-handed parallel beta-helix repeat-containing protein [Blastocatellia bacterium]MDW8238337.1 parallel beta-helix domain-containing protein [Acidobacteriota bacterium]
MKSTIIKVVSVITVVWGISIQSVHAQSIVYVKPGDRLGQIVSQAPANTTIIVAPGEYRDALVVRSPGIRLIGAGAQENGTVLSNQGVNATNGIEVRPGAHGFELSGFLIKGFNENGVLLTRVRDFRLTYNRLENNGEYGLFPIFCTGGVISNNLVIGHTDTGIYVGQSSNVIVSHNVAHGNINGIEIENSDDCTVTENETYDNVIGILIVELPLLQVTRTNRITVTKNYTHHNNNPGDHRALELFIQVIPVGGGILLVGANEVTIADNIILENNSFGIGIARLPVLFDDFDPMIDHIPDNNRIVRNLALRNGRSPDAERLAPLVPDFPTGANIYWDGTGEGNCFEENVTEDDLGGTSYPGPKALPPCSRSR